MATVSGGKIYIPEVVVSDSVFDYVKFTLSGNNSEYKVCETPAYILGSPAKSSPYSLEWTYITAGVVSVTRSKVRRKGHYEWTIAFHIHFPQRGLPAWTTNLDFNCDYSYVGRDEFHLFSLGHNSGILCIHFLCVQAAKELRQKVQEWLEAGPQPEKKRTQVNPPPTSMLISNPLKCESTLEATLTLPPDEIRKYRKEQEKLVNDIETLRTTIEGKKKDGFLLRYSVTPTAVIQHAGDEQANQEEAIQVEPSESAMYVAYDHLKLSDNKSRTLPGRIT